MPTPKKSTPKKVATPTRKTTPAKKPVVVQIPSLKSALKNKVLGCAIGAMVGDALGMPTEFKTYPFKRGGKIIKTMVSEMVDGGFYDGQGNKLTAGSFTDDTEMSLCILDAYAKDDGHRLRFENVAREFLAWYKAGPEDIGIYTQEVLSSMKTPSNWANAAVFAYCKNPIKSAANGCAMRCWSTSVVCAQVHGVGDNVKKHFYSEAVGQSMVTHLNPYAIFGAVYINLVHYYLFKGNTLKDAFTLAVNDELLTDKLPKDFEQKIRAAIAKPLPFATLVKKNENTGFVVHSVINTIHAALSTSSLEDAISYGASCGQDSDTVASIIGGVVGAYYGFNNIPKKWLTKLNGKWPINSTKKLKLQELVAKVEMFGK